MISKNIENWKKLTSDKFTIHTVLHGLKLKFYDTPVGSQIHEYKRSKAEAEIIDKEVNLLLQKKVIQMSSHEKGEHFSNLFTRVKSDGSYRMILNLKKLNANCSTHHFKMESVEHVKRMIQPNAFFASVDLKDAFFSIPIHISYRKNLKFSWRNKIYQFCCMPNGYNDAMRVFTKFLKVPFSKLREMGHLSVIYVDDSFLMGLTFQECALNIWDSINILQSLGFTIHIKKCQITPTQIIIFLGLVFNSINMTITLTEEKKLYIYNKAIKILQSSQVSIREIASFIGHIIASLPAVPYGKLYFRRLEREKNYALKCNKGNFDVKFKLSDKGKKEALWWKDNIMRSFLSLLDVPPIDMILFCDASNLGWGVYYLNLTINGRWQGIECFYHINVLEILAIQFAVLSFFSEGLKHIRIMSDNTTAVAYINKMGGQKSRMCHKIAKKICEFCIAHNV